MQALDGYGDGINESVYNYIDFEKKQFVKRVGKVVFDASSDEQWITTSGLNSTNYNAYYTRQYAENAHKSFGGASLNNLFPSRTKEQMYLDYDGAWTADTGDKQIVVKVPNSISGLGAFKTWLAENPLTVYYELATPEIIDISDILPNSIEVEGGGTITFKNEHELAMPSDVDYFVKVVPYDSDKCEIWTFTLEDGSTVTKTVVLK